MFKNIKWHTLEKNWPCEDLTFFCLAPTAVAGAYMTTLETSICLEEGIDNSKLKRKSNPTIWSNKKLLQRISGVLCPNLATILG